MSCGILILVAKKDNLLLRPVGQGVKTPPFHGGNRGSNPLRVIAIPIALTRDENPKGSSEDMPREQLLRSLERSESIPYGSYYGGLAQLGEHLPYKQRVGGSIPSASTI